MDSSSFLGTMYKRQKCVVNSDLCIKSIILHFAARIVILMPEALAEGIKTIKVAIYARNAYKILSAALKN
jgi:hypothetical protein